MKILELALVGFSLILTSCLSNEKAPSVSATAAPPKTAVKTVLDQVRDYQTNPEFQTLCLNAGQSDTGLVYLHGIDIASVSGQERGNREKLLRIAEKLHIAVALPRATGICPVNAGQICWGWTYSQEELKLVKERISSAAQTCGLKNVIALVGFSNGGYAVNALHSECMADSYGQLISIGAMLNIPTVKLKYNQGCAGAMIRLIGKQDSKNNNAAAMRLVTDNRLEKLIQVIEFDGGHEIPESLLLNQLQTRTEHAH